MASTELKTSQEWFTLSSGYVIMDPDGWDRANYDFSFNQEKISLNEYQNRVGRSTVLLHRNDVSQGETAA